MRHAHLSQLMRQIIALVSLLMLIVACSQPPPEQHVSSPLLSHYTATPASTRSPGGKLVLGSTTFPTTANPLFASTDADLAINNALWGQPVIYDARFHVLPDQLTEVPLPENGGVIDGGKTIIMHLRHDLHWSDGQPLLAGDFQYWWQLNQNALTGATIRTGYDQINSIETPDNFTVILHMKRSFAPYLSYLPYATQKP